MLSIKVIDIIIIIIIASILGLIIYFNIFKKNKNQCHNCPYAKNCNQEENHHKKLS